MTFSSLYSVIQLFVGGALFGFRAYSCLRWYLFWKRNFEGNLLTSGPYTKVRHPFYAGFLILVVGLAVLLPVIETMMLVMFSFPVIAYYVKKEEEWLLIRYGKAYRDYMKRVPWRLIPKVY